MKRERGRKALAALLSAALIFSSQLGHVFAEGDDPPQDPPVYQLTGTVYQHEYSKPEQSGEAKSDVPVEITLANGSETVTTGSDGVFTFTFTDDAQRTDTGEYSWSIASDDDHYEATGTMTEGTEEEPEENSLYIEERYVPSSSDYKFSESENVKKIGGQVWVKEAGTYAIEGVFGKKLSQSLDGTAVSTLNVSVSSSGNVGSFFIYIEALCSKILTGQKVNVDDGAPVVESVTTSPVDENTTVKEHGVYGRTKAEIILTAEITEASKIKEVYLTSKVGEETRRYDTTKVEDEDDQYKASIPLPDEGTIMDAQLVKLVAVDVFGNKSSEVLIAQTEDGSKVTLEQVAPTLSKGVIGDVSEYGWYKELPTIRATASDNLSGLNRLIIYGQGNTIASERYDDKTFDEHTISGEIKFSDLTDDGRYTYTAEARDNSLNITEEQIIVRVDTVAPEVAIAGAEEGGFYNKSPSVVINETEKYYTEEGNRIFVQVTRDGSKVLEKTITGVNKASIDESTFDTDGTYKVKIYAKDAADNESDEASMTFIKDSTAPVTSISHDGEVNKNGWLKKAPTITAKAKDPLSGLVKLTLSQDGKEKVSKDYDRSFAEESISAAADVSNPSKDGSYTFTAASEDRAGNSVKKKLVLNIDTVTPAITAEGVTTGEHYIKVPVITVTEDEKYYDAKGAGIYYEIIKDGKDFAKGSALQKNTLKIPSSRYKGNGVYKVTIYAEDAAGNRSKTLKYSFVKDTKAPVITISGASEGKYYNKSQNISVKVVEHNFKTDNVKVTAVKKLGGGTKNMGFNWKNKGEESVNSRTFSETGTYTVTASATDKAGNKAETKKLSFTVDTKAPEIVITGVTDGGIYTYGQGLSPNATVTDDYLDSKSISFTKAGQSVANPSFEQLKENDGLYTMTVTATDKAGNTTTKTVSFTVNRFGSYFEYNDAIKNLMGKGVQNVDRDLVITEKNVSKVTTSDARIYRDGSAIDAKGKTEASEGGAEKVYKHVFAASNFQPEGAYEINVTSKDDAGNEMESKQENGPVKFFVDRTAPSLTVSGIDPKGNKAESVTATVTASDLLTGVKEVSVTIDGEHPNITDNGDGTYTFVIGEGMRQAVEIKATDGAGNTEEINETASVSTNAVSLFINRFGKVLGMILAAIAVLLAILFFRRRKKKEPEDQTADQKTEDQK